MPGRPSFMLPSFLRLDFSAAWGFVLGEDDLRAFLEKAGAAVCVGDYVSRICSEALPRGIYVAVVDGATRRGPWERGVPPADAYLRVANPRGHLTLEAYTSICRASLKPPARRVVVIVEGEDDLTALAAADCSPYPVVYGLPMVGSVVLPPGPLRNVKVGAALLSMQPALAQAELNF